jgi:CRISPR-associated protein Cst2
MAIHVFANIVTSFGTAANNRGETEGNITTLQKLIWMGMPHTTISAEAIRFALRRLLAEQETNGTNRTYNEATRANVDLPRNG